MPEPVTLERVRKVWIYAINPKSFKYCLLISRCHVCDASQALDISDKSAMSEKVKRDLQKAREPALPRG